MNMFIGLLTKQSMEVVNVIKRKHFYIMQRHMSKAMT